MPGGEGDPGVDARFDQDEQAAGVGSDAAGDGERNEFCPRRCHGGCGRHLGVVPDGDEAAAQTGGTDAGGDPGDQHQRCQAQVVLAPLALTEVEAEPHGWLGIGRDGTAAGERVLLEEPGDTHDGERQGHDGEEEATDPERWKPDEQRDHDPEQGRHHHCG